MWFTLPESNLTVQLLITSVWNSVSRMIPYNSCQLYQSLSVQVIVVCLLAELYVVRRNINEIHFLYFCKLWNYIWKYTFYIYCKYSVLNVSGEVLLISVLCLHTQWHLPQQKMTYFIEKIEDFQNPALVFYDLYIHVF
jgi:hypothetical protein